MTKRATATQAQIRRAITAATKEGFVIRGIAPDGTVLLANDNEPNTIQPPVTTSAEEDWTDD